LEFFSSRCTQNPVFEYDDVQLAQKFINQFNPPNGELLDVAIKILTNCLDIYNSETNYLDEDGGRIITQEETESFFKNYLEELGLLDQVSLNFSENFVAPTSVTHFGKKSKINIALPIEYREKRIIGVLHHEIGTHFIRKYNDRLQVWCKNRKKYTLKPCIVTEEGLACINQLVETALDPKRRPFLFRSALNYYSAYKAAQMSFVELYEDLSKFIDNPRRRWKAVLRVKRGLVDTSEVGGLYKDQVYLEGAVKILRNRKNIDFKKLMCGKICLEDLAKSQIQKKMRTDKIMHPSFMKDYNTYLKALDRIAKINFIE